MRKFWAIATLNLLVFGGISAQAIMAILAGHAVSGIGAPDALTWGMAAVGPLALVVAVLIGMRLHRRSAGDAGTVDPAIAADLPGSTGVNADDAARSRLSRFARPSDLGEDAEPAEVVPDAAVNDGAFAVADEPQHGFGGDDFGSDDFASDDAPVAGPFADDAGWTETPEGADAADVEHAPASADFGDSAGWSIGEDAADWTDSRDEDDRFADDRFEDDRAVADGEEASRPMEEAASDEPFAQAQPAALPPFAADDDAMMPIAHRELPPISDWQIAEEPVGVDPLEPIDLGITPPVQDDMGGLEGLSVSRLKFTMPAERQATQWNWVYVGGAYHVAPAAETGFPWATAGIAHIAGAITASRLLPMGSQAAAEARGWREAVAGFDRSETIDPADGEAFVGWVNSLDTGDDRALRAAIDGALEALKAEAQRDHALAACLPAQFGVGQGGEAGGIALAG